MCFVWRICLALPEAEPMEVGRIKTTDSAAALVDAGMSTGVRSPELVAQERELIKAVKAVNSTDLFGYSSELTFIFDRHTGRALVRVIDRNTREVVMQVPPEYVIRMAEEGRRG
jgi:flagellar protein FlaG